VRHLVIIKLQPDVTKIVLFVGLIEEEGSFLGVGVGGIGVGFAAGILPEVELVLAKLTGLSSHPNETGYGLY
jgi:hypothetical protein